MTDDTQTVFGVEVPDLGQRVFAVVAGSLLLATFYGLDETYTTLHYSFVNVFTWSTPGEPYFWLAHALLVTPAACLSAWGIAPWVSPGFQRFGDRLVAMDRRERITGLFLLGLLGTLIARLGRAFFLYDFPVVDDEYSVRFGGQILAIGKSKVEAPPLYEHMPQLFDWYDGTHVTNMDWPVGQFFMMLSELGAGPWAHAAMAGVPLVALCLLLTKRLGIRWGVLGALFFAISPMAFVMSMTQHPHMLSRAFVALTIACFGVGMHNEESPSWIWVAAGFSLAAGLASRPFEVGSLCLPLVLWLLWRATRDKSARRACLMVGLGAIVPLALFAWHNAAVTGNPLLPPRWSGTFQYNAHISQGGFIPNSMELFWNRFGANLSYNFFMLMVWFLGPIGIGLAALGVTLDRFTRLLAAGFVLGLGIALLHDIHGVHHVGPIHYTEAAPILAVLAVCGTWRLRGWMAGHDLGFRTVGTVIAVAVMVSSLIFNLWHGKMLQRSAAIHEVLYGVLDRAEEEVPPSVVLVPNYTVLWRTFPQFQEAGSWVLKWRHNRPDGSDHFILLLDEEGLAQKAAQAYPDRPILRLEHVEDEGLILVPAL